MGLAERRAVKKYSETEFPKMKAKIDAVAGFDVPFDIAWDTLAEDDYAHLLEESIPKVYFCQCWRHSARSLLMTWARKLSRRALGAW